jgi:putative ABC transport system permease protein
MLRIALKNTLAHKGRFVLTALAVIIGTAFLAGSFIFTDTIQRTFDNLFADVYENTDAVVRSSNVIEGDFGLEQRGNLPESLVAEVAAIPGVADAQGNLGGAAVIVDANGDAITTGGSPQFGGNYTSGPLATWIVAEGRAPEGPTEVMVDRGTAKKGDLELGDTIRVAAQGASREFELVGIAEFGDVDSPGGASFALFDLPTAQEMLLRPDLTDKALVDSVLVAGDGSLDDDALADSIETALGGQAAGIEVLTGAEITEESQNDIREGLRFFTIFLTVFSFIALFVGSFVISNVFSITQAQRIREDALMRAVGASRRQVSVGLLLEAVLVGVVGSLTGLVLGIGLAELLQAALSLVGIDIPATGLMIQARTVVVTLTAGLVVTVVAAVFPAVRAGRVPPVAAMREGAYENPARRRSRLILGLVLLAVGVALVLSGLFEGKPLRLAPGIPLVFVALYVLGPLIARPVARVLGFPLERWRGVTGQLARDNSSRNPKRTSRTAAALLIGVSLVTGVSVVAASLKSSIREIFGEQFTGDFAVNLPQAGGGFGGFAPTFADELNEIDGVAAAAGIGINLAVIDGDGTGIVVVNPDVVGKVFDLGFTAGRVEDLTADGILLSVEEADDNGYAIGDILPVILADGQPRTLTVQGIYESDELAGGYTVSRELFASTTLPTVDFGIFIVSEPGSDPAAVRAALEAAVEDYGIGEVQSRSEYIDSQASQIDMIVNLVFALLALSVFIAVFGIIITLLLSVFERRRELALMRAVGMTRRQVRTMVRYEAVITSLLGTVEGIVVGLLLGYALVLALRDEGLKSFTVPWSAIVVVMVMSAILGVVAAIWPARRATRVDIVEAIATT